MKALLLSPKGSARNSRDLIIKDLLAELAQELAFMGDDTEFVPHLGLLTIAGLFPQDFAVKYLEEEYLPRDKREQLLFSQPFDLVCLTAYNSQARRAYQLAKIYKKMGSTVIMGGHHASLLPKEAKKHVDSVIIGEGETAFPQFLADFLKGEIKPFYQGKKPADLSFSPLPRFELVENFSFYNKIPLFATRGCPYNCEFCCFPPLYGRKFRHKQVEQVVAEIELVKKLHPEPYFSFSDENMLADHQFAKELVRAFIPLKIKWECYCDIGIAKDKELLGLLAQSGCRLVQVGLETVRAESLKGVEDWKAGQVKNYPSAIAKIQSYGIPFMGMFIVGLEGEDRESFARLKSFILKTGMQEMDFAVLTPMPGTPLFKRLTKEGRILSKDWDRYTWYLANFKPRLMEPEELERGILWLFKEFSQIARKIRQKEGRLPLPFHLTKGKV